MFFLLFCGGSIEAQRKHTLKTRNNIAQNRRGYGPAPAPAPAQNLKMKGVVIGVVSDSNNYFWK